MMSATAKAPYEGAPRTRSLDVDGFRVHETWFPVGLRLPPHVHERVVFAVFLEGSMDFSCAGRSHGFGAGGVLTEPSGLRHEQRFGRAGAHVIVVGPDPGREDLTRSCRSVMEEVNCFSHGGIAGKARRIARELESADSVTPLAIESLGLEMLAEAARLDERQRVQDPFPAYLTRAREMIHDRFLERLQIGDVAAEVGVRPVHLARRFRTAFHMPMGEYVRRLRLDWAAQELLDPEVAISTVALRAGFCDQSHFTRAFKRHTGFTPGQFRDWHSRARQVRARESGALG